MKIWLLYTSRYTTSFNSKKSVAIIATAIRIMGTIMAVGYASPLYKFPRKLGISFLFIDIPHSRSINKKRCQIQTDQEDDRESAACGEKSFILRYHISIRDCDN